MMIIYEQPTNEHIRLCLKLEHLFKSLKMMLRHSTAQDHRIVISHLLQILLVSDRPDLKAKLSQVLTAHATSLAKLKDLPDVDTKKLDQLLIDIQTLSEGLHGSYAKIGNNLREDPILKLLLPYAHVPGEDGGFGVPTFTLWLSQPAPWRAQIILAWWEELSLLRQVIALILRLTRDTHRLDTENAEGRFFQKTLDPKLDTQLIRVGIDQTFSLFPEISVGRHRLAIHFMENPELEIPIQTRSDPICFHLACCSI